MMLAALVNNTARLLSRKNSKEMFSALPVELVEHILSFLDHDDKSTIAAICRVNRLLHEVGTPLLYRNVGIFKVDCDRRERSRRLQLHIDGGSTESLPIVEDLELEAIRDLFSRDLDLPMDVFEFLDFDASEASEEGWLLTLLIICPKARTLSLIGEVNYFDSWEGLSYVLHEIRSAEYENEEADGKTTAAAVRPNSTSFHTIQNVELECQGGEPRVDTDDLEALLWLPAMQSLRMDTFSPSSEIVDSPPAFQSRIQKLEINNCFAKGDDFEELLAMCDSLKSLTIEWPSREDNYRRFDWADLGNSITENCPALEYLRLDHPRDFMLDDDDFVNMVGDLNDEYLQNCQLPGLGSLRSLEHLQTLFISNTALFGTQRDDSFVPADVSDSDDGDETKHCLESVVPESLKELVVLCEHQGLDPDDTAILNEPGAERLEQLTIMDCQKDVWVARKHGQLTASTPKLLATLRH